LSELALGVEAEFVELRRLLEQAVERGRLICPYSPGHRDEAALARVESYKVIEKLGDVLAMGIEFLARELIEWHELYAAGQAFLGQEPRPLWKQAFRGTRTRRARIRTSTQRSLSLRVKRQCGSSRWSADSCTPQLLPTRRIGRASVGRSSQNRRYGPYRTSIR
jgi:hypothetical protein